MIVQRDSNDVDSLDKYRVVKLVNTHLQDLLVVQLSIFPCDYLGFVPVAGRMDWSMVTAT